MCYRVNVDGMWCELELDTGDWEVSGTLGQIDAIERAASLFPADHDPDQLLAFVLSERSERCRVDAAQAPKGEDSDAMTDGIPR